MPPCHRVCTHARSRDVLHDIFVSLACALYLGFVVHHTKLMCAAAKLAVRLGSGNGFAHCSCRSLCCPFHFLLADICARLFVVALHPASFLSLRLCFTRPRELYLELRSEYSISLNYFVSLPALCASPFLFVTVTIVSHSCIIDAATSILLICVARQPTSSPFALPSRLLALALLAALTS